MKANEYVAKYKPQIDAAVAEDNILQVGSVISELLVELIDEAVKTGTNRAGGNKPNDRIMGPVLREFDLKYRAIANQIEALDTNGWRRLFAKVFEG